MLWSNVSQHAIATEAQTHKWLNQAAKCDEVWDWRSIGKEWSYYN